MHSLRYSPNFFFIIVGSPKNCDTKSTLMVKFPGTVKYGALKLSFHKRISSN